MSDTTAPVRPARAAAPLWMILASACFIVALAMGLRQVMGLYLKPITEELKIGREVFGLAMAIANIVWGIGAPFAGAIADKLYGTGRVVAAGALMTICGLVVMYHAGSEAWLLLSGLFLGLGVSGTGITVLVGAVGRAAPPEKRTSAIATIGMGSGMGVLLAVPYTHLLIEFTGWHTSLLVLAATALLMLPLAATLGGGAAQQAARPQTLGEALSEAFRYPSFWLLTVGFFVCGFHVAFYAVHLPAFVADKGLSPSIAMWALVVVGIGNIIGTWLAGQSARFMPKRYGLCLIYIGRAFIFLGILYLPTTETTVLVFSGLLGLLWLSTVPLTSSLVATFFGPVWMSMLFGIVFFSHQLGSFLGVWLGGRIFDVTRSYDMVWWISIGLGVFAALVHWPISEKPVPRLRPQPA